MEDKNEMEDKKEGADHCHCVMCRAHNMMHGKMCCGHHHSLIHAFLRIIILLVIIGVIFSIGVKLGGLRSESCGSRFNKEYYGYRMMYPAGYGNSAQQTSTTSR